MGLTTRDVADQLHLLVSHVRGIEADRYAALGCDDQIVERVRAYAHLLNLNAQDIVEAYRAAADRCAVQIPPSPAEDDSQHQRGAWIVVTLLVLVGMYFSIWSLNRGASTDSADSQPTAVVSTADTSIVLPEPPMAANIASRKVSNDVPDDSMRFETASVSSSELPVSYRQTSPAPDSSPTELPKVRSNTWFASLPPDRYTIQLISLTDATSVLKFVQDQGLVDDAATFTTLRQDQTWYAVTVGLYESFDAAQWAIAKLPEHLRALAPRVRNTGRIQQLMWEPTDATPVSEEQLVIPRSSQPQRLDI